jgi:hypothetical protein
MDHIETVCQELHALVKGLEPVCDESYRKRVLAVFPNPSMVTIEDIIERYDFEEKLDCRNPTAVKHAIDTYIFSGPHKGIGAWFENEGQHEWFILEMLKNGGWTVEDVQRLYDDMWRTDEIEMPFHRIVPDLVEFKQILDKHPELSVRWVPRAGDEGAYSPGIFANPKWGVIFEDIANGHAKEILVPLLQHKILSIDEVTDRVTGHYGGKRYLAEVINFSWSCMKDPLPPKMDPKCMVCCARLGQKATETFLKESFKDTDMTELEDAISFALSHESWYVNIIFDDWGQQWEGNIEILSASKKLISKHPEWTYLQPGITNYKGDWVPPTNVPLRIYIDPDTISHNIDEAENQIKTFQKAGLVDDDYLTWLVEATLHSDYLGAHCFEDLARVRELKRRNPSWTVDYTGDWINTLEACAIPSEEVGMKFVERLMSEGYWTPEILQKHVDGIFMFDDYKGHRQEVLKETAKLLAKHPEWTYKNADGVTHRVTIDLKQDTPDLSKLAFELGADQVSVDRQSMVDSIAAAHREAHSAADDAKTVMKFFGSKM